MSSKQVYDKASGILAVIISHANTGCIHCLDLIKSGLREPTPNPTVDDNADTNSSFAKQRDDGIP